MSSDGPSAPEPAEGASTALPHGGRTAPARERLLRHARHARLYSSTAAIVALLVVIVLLISVNSHRVKIDWVIGSTRASLVWIVLAATVLGWLLGLATGVVFRHRTRRRRP